MFDENKLVQVVEDYLSGKMEGIYNIHPVHKIYMTHALCGLGYIDIYRDYYHLDNSMDHIYRLDVNGYDSLHYALFSGCDEMVSELLNYDAHHGYLYKHRGNYLSFCAHSNLTYNLIKKLINHGFDVFVAADANDMKIQDDSSSCLLRCAIDIPDMSLIDLLCNYGADIDHIYTPNGKTNIVLYAFEKLNANKIYKPVDQEDARKRYIRVKKYITIIKRMVSRVAEIELRNNSGYTAMMLAGIYRIPTLKKLIKEEIEIRKHKRIYNI